MILAGKKVSYLAWCSVTSGLVLIFSRYFSLHKFLDSSFFCMFRFLIISYFLVHLLSDGASFNMFNKLTALSLQLSTTETWLWTRWLRSPAPCAPAPRRGSCLAPWKRSLEQPRWAYIVFALPCCCSRILSFLYCVYPLILPLSCIIVIHRCFCLSFCTKLYLEIILVTPFIDPDLHLVDM